ncbi:MAG: extracellular solute-binding protein [Roseburia sp.]|nr:extracellular solute-binding protein [Roseburia sp.]
MQLKTRFMAAAAAVAMVVLALFGSTTEIREVMNRTEASQEADKKEILYFWYSDDALTNYINSAAVSFGEREGVHVIPVLRSDSAYLEAVNQASVDNDRQFPDAYVINNDALEKAYLAGLACEVGDDGAICNEQHFPRTALSAVSYQGKKIAYPFYYETSVLMYNQTYLNQWREQQEQKAEEEEAGDDSEEDMAEAEETDSEENSMEGQILPEGIPLTMDGLRYIADTFDVPEGVEGIMKWDVSDIFYNYWFVGEYLVVGGDSGDDDKRIDINNPQTIECLEIYQALNQFFSIESDTVTYDSCIQDFIDGKLVFTLGSTELVRRMEEEKAAGNFRYEYGFTTMPKVSGSLESRSLSVTDAVVINGYSPNRELANRFAVFLTDEYATKLYERAGKVSANVNANRDNDALQIFLQEYSDSVSLPKLMEIGNLWLQLEALFAKVWNGAQATPLVEELAGQIQTQLIMR